MEAGEKKLKRKIEAAEQMGRDVVYFGLEEGKDQRARKINDRDECNPPTKKQRSDAKMLEKRTNTARCESVVMKIRKVELINSFKREYVVTSATGKAQYIVSISNVPTCTCRDFQINGERVICKHITFVLLNVLKLKDETILSKIWFEETDLTNLFNEAPKQIPSDYFQPTEPVNSKKDYPAILQSHPLFHQEQKVTLQKKEKRSAQCRGCRLVLNVGESVLKIEGALTVPYKKNKATEEVIYSCPNPNCIARMPKWTNVRKVEKVEVSENITPAEKTELFNLFRI